MLRADIMFGFGIFYSYDLVKKYLLSTRLLKITAYYWCKLIWTEGKWLADHILKE